MEICPHCKQEFKDARALNIHITVAHIAYKIADIEEQFKQQTSRLCAIEDNAEKQRQFNTLMLDGLEMLAKRIDGQRKQTRELQEIGINTMTGLQQTLDLIEKNMGDGFHSLGVLYERKKD